MSKPFLRWAGGKTWMLSYIDKLLPASIANYHEPFLGGGSIFFYLKEKGIIKGKAFLSDSNEELINTYRILKSKPAELFKLLKEHQNTVDEYYRIRSTIYIDDVERAARFLFLNRTSFNGIYRVNRSGSYNVPYGYKKYKELYDFDELSKASACFKNCFFSVMDFKRVTSKVGAGDFVFFDPPYTVAHENNGFIHYNQSLFSWQNQIELSKLLPQIKLLGANFILTNACHKSIEGIYNDKANKTILSRASTIGGIGASRTKYNELIYKNY
ncbi:MAG: Dam family site-specific DNA-(adenine-N6)-methyltransferase [Bacteroidota bacterium]